jgi:hypothetical protein
MLDEENNSICYLSRLVEGPIHIFHFSWSCQFLGFEAKLLYNLRVDEIFGGSSIEECFLDGSFWSGMQQEGNMDVFLSSNIHGVW